MVRPLLRRPLGYTRYMLPVVIALLLLPACDVVRSERRPGFRQRSRSSTNKAATTSMSRRAGSPPVSAVIHRLASPPGGAVTVAGSGRRVALGGRSTARQVRLVLRRELRPGRAVDGTARAVEQGMPSSPRKDRDFKPKNRDATPQASLERPPAVPVDPLSQSPDAPIVFTSPDEVARGNMERANAEPEPAALHSAKTPGVPDMAKKRRRKAR